jgi:Tol biopolymer transport system component
MRVFISYRRKTWPFTHRLAESLRKQIRGKVFVDFDSVDESDFEQSILRNLRESDAFLLVVSKETFDPERIHQENDWVRREIAEALRLDLPIVLALVEGRPPPKSDALPEDIRAVVVRQGIEFYPRFFDAGVKELTAFIKKTTRPPISWPAVIGSAVLAAVVIGAITLGVLSQVDGLGRDSASPEPTQTPTAIEETPTQAEVEPTASPTPDIVETATPTVTSTPISLVISEANLEQVKAVTTLGGHLAKVLSLSWSPDGTSLASGGADGLVLTWEAETGERLRRLEGHDFAASIYDVAYTPDGSRLASAASDGAVIIWDVETGLPLRRLAGGQTLAWSPDGEMLVTSFGNILNLWNPLSFDILEELVGHDANVESLVFSPNGGKFASGSQDNTVAIWDVESGERLQLLEGHSDDVGTVAWSPNGAALASASRDGRIIIWHADTGLRLRTLGGIGEAAEGISWSPDGSMLVSGGGSTLVVWDAEAGIPRREWPGLRQRVFSVAWSPDGLRIASGREDGTVILWEVVP